MKLPPHHATLFRKSEPFRVGANTYLEATEDVVFHQSEWTAIETWAKENGINPGVVNLKEQYPSVIFGNGPWNAFDIEDMDGVLTLTRMNGGNATREEALSKAVEYGAVNLRKFWASLNKTDPLVELDF